VAAHVKHVVVVIQENRSLDNLFNGFCLTSGDCADTVRVDPVTHRALAPVSLAAPFDPNHEHAQFIVEYDYGKMDGFSQSSIDCPPGSPCDYSVFGFVPAAETAIYRRLATVDGILSDETFATDQGSSWASHMYAIAGQSGGYDPDHYAITGAGGTCATQQLQASQVNMTTPFPGMPGPTVRPCKDFQTIFDRLTAAHRTWRYYSGGQGYWSPTQGVQHLFGSPNYIEPPSAFLTDVKNGLLSDVTFVAPEPADSDHAGAVSDWRAGPTWVASVLDAVGESPFWDSTAVVVWWDEWGGWFDHVRPPASPVNPDPFEYGFRVPLIVVSPYARVGAIDHTPRTFVSALRLIEEAFRLPSLETTDQFEPDGLDSMFDFARNPMRYTPLGGSSSASRPNRPRRTITLPLDDGAP
jgi:phospholipase C